MRYDALAGLGFAVLLAACGPVTPPASIPPPPKPAEPALVLPPRVPEPMEKRSAVRHMLPGLEGVIGASSAELARLFGPPRLDVIEGDARKIQFTGETCVLDVYLYPMTRGGELEATYAEARNPVTGQTIDSVACVNALRPPPPPAPVVPAAVPKKRPPSSGSRR